MVPCFCLQKHVFAVSCRFFVVGFKLNEDRAHMLLKTEAWHQDLAGGMFLKTYPDGAMLLSAKACLRCSGMMPQPQRSKGCFWRARWSESRNQRQERSLARSGRRQKQENVR
jgi:hypothetical protein